MIRNLRTILFLLVAFFSLSSGSHVAFYGMDGTVTETESLIAENLPYGEITGGVNYQSRYIYTAKEWVPELQQFYFGQRYYDPALGIWNSRDKLEQFYSPYTYTGPGNNPLISRDADGWAVTRDMPSFYAKSGIARFQQGAHNEIAELNYTYGTTEGLKGLFSGLLVQFTCMYSNSLAACQPIMDGMVDEAKEFIDDPWAGAGKIAVGGVLGKLGKGVKWTPHGGKHVARKNVSWKKVIKSTKSGPAKYKHGTDIEKLEREVWDAGQKVTNGKDWKVMEFDVEVGASGGKSSRWVRVERSADTIHGHPITFEEYQKLTK